MKAGRNAPKGRINAILHKRSSVNRIESASAFVDTPDDSCKAIDPSGIPCDVVKSVAELFHMITDGAKAYTHECLSYFDVPIVLKSPGIRPCGRMVSIDRDVTGSGHVVRIKQFLRSLIKQRWS